MTQTAKAYAEALFALSCEEGNEAEVLTALHFVGEAFSGEPELVLLLSSPTIPTEERVGVAETIFAEQVPEHVLSFLCLLCEKGDVSLWGDCTRSYEALYHEHCATVEAVAIGARPFTDAEREALVRQLEKKSGRHVALTCRVDPEILGGVIVEMDGTVTDGSLRHRLQQIKEGLNP